MIDASKCVYEDSWKNGMIEGKLEVDHYFVYPKELGMNEAEFYTEENYGNVVSTCIMLVTLGGAPSHLIISPTVEDEEGDLSDVDWRDIFLGKNYTEETMSQLAAIALQHENGTEDGV